jgi:hypothetical protein
VDNVGLHTQAYILVASVLEGLALLEENGENVKVQTLQIMNILIGNFKSQNWGFLLFCHYLLTGTPSEWPTRSVAALLLSLHLRRSPLVAIYFNQLNSCGVSEKIRDILVEAVFASTLIRPKVNLFCLVLNVNIF